MSTKLEQAKNKLQELAKKNAQRETDRKEAPKVVEEPKVPKKEPKEPKVPKKMVEEPTVPVVEEPKVPKKEPKVTRKPTITVLNIEGELPRVFADRISAAKVWYKYRLECGMDPNEEGSEDVVDWTSGEWIDQVFEDANGELMDVDIETYNGDPVKDFEEE
jgi:hypothetical protein